ncbi:TRAM domain-containing protein [Halorubrum sp. N11]|uniref:TRAM domain-containing protein n=1 Tax=Halorubrum sp. N11 TaxID=3402276 RepID=UPI003EB992CE
MNISDELHTLYTAQLTESDGSYQIEVPRRQIETGELTVGDTYRVALISQDDTATAPTETTVESTPGTEVEPPVAEGETREVEIENLGEQGDGIAKIDRGYVVIVPETNIGEQVIVEMKTVRDNVAFADVIERNL